MQYGKRRHKDELAHLDKLKRQEQLWEGKLAALREQIIASEELVARSDQLEKHREATAKWRIHKAKREALHAGAPIVEVDATLSPAAQRVTSAAEAIAKGTSSFAISPEVRAMLDAASTKVAPSVQPDEQDADYDPLDNDPDYLAYVAQQKEGTAK
jgi:hypothetical protein